MACAPLQLVSEGREGHDSRGLLSEHGRAVFAVRRLHNRALRESEWHVSQAFWRAGLQRERAESRDADVAPRGRELCTKLADAMAPGGLVLFDAFLPVDGYKPDPTIRQISHTVWCCLFTRAELQFIHTELPFDRVSDESEHDYEQEHLPPDAWPPTSWFPEWSQGLNLFDVRPGKSPVELRWLVYRRR